LIHSTEKNACILNRIAMMAIPAQWTSATTENALMCQLTAMTEIRAHMIGVIPGPDATIPANATMAIPAQETIAILYRAAIILP